MNLKKAIEILELELPEYLSNPDTDLMHAIKLGNEALKVLEANRDPESPLYIGLLPGETK